MIAHDIFQATTSNYCALGTIEKPLMKKGAQGDLVVFRSMVQYLLNIE
jgi:hypothetical protein